MNQFIKVFEPGDEIFQESSLGDKCYYIERGRVEVSRMVSGRKKVLDILSAGESFGEYALLRADESKRSATVTVLERTVLVEIDKASLDEILREVPSFVLLLIKSLVSKVISMEESMINMQEQLDTLLEGDSLH